MVFTLSFIWHLYPSYTYQVFSNIPLSYYYGTSPPKACPQNDILSKWHLN